MKKTLLAIYSVLFIGCASTNDTIYSQDEEQNLISKGALFSTSNRQALNITDLGTTIMDLEIASAIQGSSGGCSYIDENINGTYVTTRAFGPNPLELYGYQVRGYGRPRRSLDWKGIRLLAGNRPQIVNSGGGFSPGENFSIDDQYTSAISIEFPFETNTTYEIILGTIIEDNIYKEQHDQYQQQDDYHGLQQSQGFPTVALELKDTPEIPGTTPCSGRPLVQNVFISPNYYKKQKAEITVPPSYEAKNFTFNFSTTEAKKAFIIYFLPNNSGGVQPIPENSFSMYLKNLKIIKKPFDPSHIVSPPVNPPCPGGMRGC
ncbi:hypothetical protein [Chryseobacterium sp.]|uniref:hypothetical protein n=1 Tax=Chryseobacterium sp. TaxID=1871047 RepID=UPI003342A4D5